MAKLPRFVRRLLLVLIAGTFSLTPLWSQAETGRARIALFTPAGAKIDATLTAVLGTMADSVELSLVCLERYEVRRLPSADPVREMGRVRSYCQDNRIDQAIVGSGSARSEGGYTFRLAVYDRRSDSVTVDKEGVCSGALDMFDTADALVASLLDGLSGTHLLFGSLIVDTDPAGALISINGRDVGASPVTLRGLPVGVVRVAARSAGREQAESSVTVLDGETSRASLTLIAKPGSIRVETTPVSTSVSLDGEKTLTTPCTFEAVSPGTHTLRIRDVLLYRRYLTSEHAYAVEVTPDGRATVSAQLVPATATLQIVGAPASGTVSIEGTKWNPGDEVPAGTLDIVISTPSGQTWKQTTTLGPGGEIQLRMNSFVTSLPRRTINVDGKVDDWNGIEPLWGGVREQGDRYGFWGSTSMTELFPNQTGTRLANAWLCRDDEKIYMRLDFDDGRPSQNLSKDIKGTLKREIRILLPGNKMLHAGVASNRSSGTNAPIDLWGEPAHSNTYLGEVSGYATAGSTLEIAIPLNRVEKYLPAGPVDVDFSVSDGGMMDWNRGYSTYDCPVDFRN